jgi:hypothetical protein
MPFAIALVLVVYVAGGYLTRRHLPPRLHLEPVERHLAVVFWPVTIAFLGGILALAYLFVASKPYWERFTDDGGRRR